MKQTMTVEDYLKYLDQMIRISEAKARAELAREGK